MIVLRRAGVLEDILSNCGIDKESSTKDRVAALARILEMDADELFRRYMTWQGIIGYESEIIWALKAIQSATGTRLV